LIISLADLKDEMAKGQSYSRDWIYTWNPLESRPLVAFDPAFPDRVLCPIPRYLLRRATGGIFFDLVTSPDFGLAFGDSFESYMGEVIALTCPPPRFTATPEEPFEVGKNRMHGVDWILSDVSGHLFIESKTKRLTVGAKTLSDTVALDKDIAAMAVAIAQHYMNIRLAQEGKSNWVPDTLPIYPLVLTLEDWFIFSPRVQGMLKDHVRRLLTERCISLKVLERLPYTIASANEFEILSQVIGQVGIASVMAKKTERETESWTWIPFLNEYFKSELQSVKKSLFIEDLQALSKTFATPSRHLEPAF
jgi:hypothetical protein